MTPASLVLASSSPRRREILARLTDDFAVIPADLDETPRPGEGADAYVVRLAEEKALAVATPGTVAIGADTAVVLDGEILGKPVSRPDAATMLRRLSGRDHEVLTGIAVVRHDDGGPEVASAVETSIVTITDLDDALIDWYVATGEGDDKAGGYGLQGRGAVFADIVHGSVTNVVGLPLPRLFRMLADAGVLAWYP